MNMKHLNHAGIAGLFLVAFASAAFAESEQLHEQQQIQQQQREQIQSREHMPSDQGVQQSEQNRSRTMTEEQERLHQQQINGRRSVPTEGYDAARRTRDGIAWRGHGRRWRPRPVESCLPLFFSRQVMEGRPRSNQARVLGVFVFNYDTRY